jgi:Uma2 family endonuclease
MNSRAAQMLPHDTPSAAAIPAYAVRAASEFIQENALIRSGMLLARRCRMPSMKAVDPRVTFAELQEWPDDGRRYELYDGEVIVVPSAFPRHQRVAMHIGDILGDYERRTGGLMFCVPIDIVFSEHNVVQPDVVFFRKERRHVIDMMAATRAAPDLAVEVLSRSTEARDRGRKMQLLARFGVPEYWIVDPVKNTFEIYMLRGSVYERVAALDEHENVISATLPDLAFPAARVFEE